MAKFSYICPMCDTELELLKRVTLNRRGCPTCNHEIYPSEIDRQLQAKEAAWELDIKKRAFILNEIKKKQAFIENEIKEGLSKLETAAEITTTLAMCAGAFVIFPFAGICTRPALCLSISGTALVVFCVFMVAFALLKKYIHVRRSEIKESAAARFSFLHNPSGAETFSTPAHPNGIQCLDHSG